MGKLIGVLLVSVVLLGGCSASDAPAPESAPAVTAATTHEVTALTRLVGRRVYYEEGAQVQLRMDPAEDMVGPVGGTTRWTVREGEHRLVGATRSCSGNCGYLDAPTDACRRDVEVVGATRLLVTFRWGRPCRITVLPSEGPLWACVPSRRSTYMTDPVVHDLGVPLRRIVQRYDEGAADVAVDVRGLHARVTYRDAAGLITARDRWSRTDRTGWAVQGGTRCAGR